MNIRRLFKKNAGEVEEGELVLMTPPHQCFWQSLKGTVYCKRPYLKALTLSFVVIML